jgi:hypothetical protein
MGAWRLGNSVGLYSVPIPYLKNSGHTVPVVGGTRGGKLGVMSGQGGLGLKNTQGVAQHGAN